MNSLACPGAITLDDLGVPQCLDGWQTLPAVVPFDPSQLDPALVATFFGAGLVFTAPVMGVIWAGSMFFKSVRGR